MPAPFGLGWWVAFEGAITPGNKAADLARAREVLRATGARWVCLRSGAGGQADASLTEDSIRFFDDAGFAVYLWPFCYAAALEGELAILRRWRALCRPGGDPVVAGVILNAEFEFIAHATPAAAALLVQRTRALGYDFVGHAPPDYAGGRGDGAMKVLDANCDMIFPQVYAFEHDDQGHLHHVAAVLELYARRNYVEKVSPILCSYRPLRRGKRPTPVLPAEPHVVARDCVAGLVDLHARGVLVPSFYSIDALSFASRPGVGAAVLEAISRLQSLRLSCSGN